MVESHRWLPGDVITSARLNSLECRTLDSVAAMASAGLSAGAVVATRGWAAPNDGGAAAYDIRARQAGDQLDDWSLIAIGDTLTAVLRLPPVLDCRSCGIMPNTSEDSSTRINAVLAKLQSIWGADDAGRQARPILYMPAGRYWCDNPITSHRGETAIKGDYPPAGWSMGSNVQGTKLDFSRAKFTDAACVNGPSVEQIWIACGAYSVKEDRTKLDPTDAVNYGGWYTPTTTRANVDGLHVSQSAHRVVVTGASGIGIIGGTAVDCTDCAVYTSRTGYQFDNDNLIYGMYGFTLETFIRFRGAISTLIGARCDSCYGDALVFENVSKSTATGVNLDWVGGAAVRFGGNAFGNSVTNLTCSRVATHGSSLAGADPAPGHGMIRLTGNATGNHVQLLTGRDGVLDKPTDGVINYQTPGVPVVCDGISTNTVNRVDIRGGRYAFLESNGHESTLVTKTTGSTNAGQLVIDNGLGTRTIDLSTIQ